MGFETGAGEFMQLGSYNAAQLRRSVYMWAARTAANTPGLISGGLLSSTDMQLTAGVSGLVVNTSVGECLIGGSEATSQGGYHGFLSSQNSTTLATANASNPRIDLICATCGDASYSLPSGGTSGALTIQGVTGTPTAGATLSNLSGAPALPASSLLLGYVLVPAAATNLTSIDILNVAAVVQAGVYVPGMLLGKTINTTSGNFGINTSALTAFGSPAQVTFVAPPSKAVTVQLSGTISVGSATGAGKQVQWAVFSGGSQIGPYVYALGTSVASTATALVNSLQTIDVTGLTAGSSYTFAWAGFATDSNLFMAINSTTPGVMKVYAA